MCSWKQYNLVIVNDKCRYKDNSDGGHCLLNLCCKPATNIQHE